MAKLIPLTVIIIGILFILRGLNIGIPYISPTENKLKIENRTENKTEEQNSCH